MRLGSSEGIALLDKWRGRHQPPNTTSDVSPLRCKRSSSQSVIGEMVVTKRAHHESLTVAGNDSQTHSDSESSQPPSDDGLEIVNVPLMVKSTLRGGLSHASSSAGDSRANPLTLSDDEPEFIQGSSSSPHKGKKRSDDEPEFIQGSSSSPYKGKKRSDAPHRKPKKEPKRDHNGALIIDLTDP